MTDEPTSPRPDRLRLFVAVDVPSATRAYVSSVVEAISARFPHARWTDPANQHITLKFLGWVEASALGDVADACVRVAADSAPARLALGELGAFPSRTRVRVLWVGLQDREGLLARVAGALDSALGPLGFEAEQRAFTAHLTVARFKAPVRPGEWPDVALDERPWTCSELVLYRSHLSPKGARYEAVRSFRLGG